MLSEEWKEKIAEAHRGIKFTEEHKQAISESLKGKKPYDMTKEVQEKISKSVKLHTQQIQMSADQDTFTYGTGKLTPAQALLIRKIYIFEETSIKKLCADFGISRQGLQYILKGEVWKNIKDDNNLLERCKEKFFILHKGHGIKKLTDDNVREIRKLFHSGKYTKKCLSQIFDVNPATIIGILGKKIYRGVLDENV